MTEKESPQISTPTSEDEQDEDSTLISISDISGKLYDIYDQELTCLVSDLVKEPSYEMMFEYCISLPRILSVLTIYIMKTFLPSIGHEIDWGERNGTEYEGEKRTGIPGGKYRSFFNKGFAQWDKDDLFQRSKKLSRTIFLSYYNSMDPNWTWPKFKFSVGWPSISWGLFWWLRKLEKHDVFDGDGNPC